MSTVPSLNDRHICYARTAGTRHRPGHAAAFEIANLQQANYSAIKRTFDLFVSMIR